MSSAAHHRTASQPQPMPPLQLSFPDHIQSPLSQPPLSASTESVSVPALAGAPTLVEFLHTTPAPLVALLVRLAPTVAAARRALEVLSWKGKGKWVDGCLLIAAWWALVLFADYALLYFIPAIVLSIVVVSRHRTFSKPHSPAPVTETALQATLTDLSILHSLLPPYPTLPGPLRSPPLPLLTRAFLALYAPYLLLTYLVPLRILLGIVGTIILTHRAQPARLLRQALWRSAHVRWGVYKAYSVLTGTDLPFPPPTVSTVHITEESESMKARFAFTVFENQRWWVGLDWTAALLPNERPSWCDAALQPVPPPAAFALPSPTTAFLPAPENPNARERRVASWAWEQSEWSVIVKKDDGAKDVAKKIEGEGTEGGAGEGTDAEGWVYGDNKWEGKSGKGSLSKYTRYRRWSRVAVLTETIELVGPGPTGIVREDDDDLAPLPSPAYASSTRGDGKDSSQDGPERVASPDERRHLGLGGVGGVLRQRLQAAVSGH